MKNYLMLDLTAMNVCVLTYASAGEGLEKFRAAVHVGKWPYSNFSSTSFPPCLFFVLSLIVI